MPFTTDKQTLEDLNIFGKHGTGSVFAIFNHCATSGGAAVLNEMFHYPLSDEQEINRRGSIIRHFAVSGSSFPFNASLFDAAELYLKNTDERTKLGRQEHTLGSKLEHMIAPDARTQQIHLGIQSLTELFKAVKKFSGSLGINDAHAYRQEQYAIESVLSEPAFNDVLAHTGKFNQSTLAAFDITLRFQYRNLVHKLLKHLYYLDVYISAALVARQRNFTFPHAKPGGVQTLLLEGVYHPELENVVSNDIEATTKSNVIFLTGANMAGKSTFMKSLSIALFLAHMGFPVPAKRMVFSVLDGMFTTINLPDDLGMGASHFYAEVLRVKKMALELSTGKNLFILFDELFRGTNVKDAYEATIAITSAFAGKRNSLFVISTHIVEAADVLKENCANVRFVYLPTKMDGTRPVYTYKLAEGVTNDRHGMVIIKNEGILSILEEGLKKSIQA